MASDLVSPEKDRPFVLIALKEDEVDSVFTPWTINHLLSGAAAKAVGMNFTTNFLLHGMYEVKDQMSKDEIYNSAINSLGDQFASMTGHYMANKGQTVWVYLWFACYAAAIYTGNAFG